MADLTRYCCQNKDCPDYGKRGIGNLTTRRLYKIDPERRLLQCKTCGQRFSNRRGTVFFDSRLPREKIVNVLAHIADGCGIRQTSRLTGVPVNTVMRLCRLAGDHARALHDELLAFSPRN
jgi:transposase-like protein